MIVNQLFEQLYINQQPTTWSQSIIYVCIEGLIYLHSK